MRTTIFLILSLLFSISTFAQKKIVVMPKVAKGGTICNAYQIYDNKISISAVENVYKKNRYSVVNSSAIIEQLYSSGGCYKANDEVQNEIISQNGLKLYTQIAAKTKTSYNGSFVEITVNVFDVSERRLLATQVSKSTPNYSTDKKKQIEQAFEKIIKPLMQTATANLAAGKYLDVPKAVVIPVIKQAPEKETPKEEVLLVKKEVPVEEVVEVYSSDVDINIPKSNKVNEDAVAVIIGNKAYRNPDVPEVKYAVHDAKIMKKYLIETFGFREGNIIYKENATQADFNAIFGIKGNAKGKLYNYVKPNKSDVFVFYSGHGAPNPESKEGFFVPVDTDPSLIQFNGYSLTTFYKNLGEVPYKSLNVVIDACFSGSSDGGMLLKSISPVFIKTENKVMNDELAVIMSASQSEQVASWYNDQNHGLFTYFYLKGLQGAADTNNDNKISVKEMSEYITSNVEYMARRLNNREQKPQVVGDATILIRE
ncbi:caspase family protein [Flammeovirga pectinis]|uniref:Caspase family protein n=1 Tax=Flammeovirga pectinis TaxID=2494373 RepID=A0A3Q9FLP0_9BACT|nr:caspase family protein [Flammeovirga pectinis]AZQ62939.1 caspase family protein [Flammeovirga pectinis]